MIDPTASTPDLPVPNSPQKTAKPLKPQEFQPSRRLRAWRFWVVMLFQSALIAAVPFQSALTYATGQTVTLKTLPVDPYDLLRGYSQTLRFDISDLDRLKQLPGAAAILNESEQHQARQFYVTLEAPAVQSQDAVDSAMPVAWEPVAVSLDLPKSLADNQVALKGHTSYWDARYGLETYYMPESQRNDINDHISGTQQSDFVVNVRIDGKGNSVPLSLWVGDQQYRF